MEKRAMIIRIIKRIGWGIFWFVCIIAIMCLFAVPWLNYYIDSISIDSLMFYAGMGLDHGNLSVVWDCLQTVGIPTVLLTCLVVFLVLINKRKHWISDSVLQRVGVIGGCLICLISGVVVVKGLHVKEFLNNTLNDSQLIEQEYVDPSGVEVQFPEKKRNLIYIFLESMESSYMDASNGGCFSENYIPELTKLCQQNTNFSDTSGVGGYHMITGSDYTTAGIFAQTSGLPLKIPFELNEYEYGSFMPGVTSLGEILQKEGYHNYFTIGSDKKFGGRSNYLEEHGDYTIFDYQSAIDAGKISSDYKVWWGYEDEKLFEYAKEQLSEISKKDAPFNYTLLTVDTHFPDGYQCKLCEDQFSDQYANVLACSSRQVYEFVKWIQKQDFYENTGIIICGDHQTRQKKFVPSEKSEDRRVYNVFINSAVSTEHTKNREVTAMDMFPTTLATLGVKIPGERLGIGTNLFSDVPTLAEEMGWDKFKGEVEKKSIFYNNTFYDIKNRH